MRVATSLPPHLPVIERPGAGRSYGILTTFPPTACGIATFSAALAGALTEGGRTVGIVRVADETATDLRPDPRVRSVLHRAPDSAAEAAGVLDTFDVAIVQHEYGIYNGADGDEVVDIVASLDVPSVVVAHTVLLDPTPHQRDVLEAVVDAASIVVVMTEAARQRLGSQYDVDSSKVVVIPHGAAAQPFGGMPRGEPHPEHPTLLTWGLLGPGKGIEWAIEAVARLKATGMAPRYRVAGRTHPKVAEVEGEQYREMLVRRSWETGVAPLVSFDPTYRDLESLARIVQEADVVVLPYDSVDQVTSGVLVDAIAAGRPVVATAFPHAMELLSSGAGLVVPRRDPVALADALHQVLTEPGLATGMAAEARRLAPQLSWSAVADQYARLADQVLADVRSATG